LQFGSANSGFEPQSLEGTKDGVKGFEVETLKRKKGKNTKKGGVGVLMKTSRALSGSAAAKTGWLCATESDRERILSVFKELNLVTG